MSRTALATTLGLLLCVAVPGAAAAAVQVHAHRGGTFVDGAATYAENTLPAYQAAHAAGFVVELDTRATQDGAIALHDETLDRTTTCTGLAADTTLAAVASCPSDFVGSPGSSLEGVDDRPDRVLRERDQVRVAVHEADEAAVRDDLDDVAREQGAALGDVEDGAARVVAAAADQRQPAAERERLARPQRHRGGGAHDPVGVVGVQVHRAAESLGPLDHPRVVVRVRDRDPGEPAAVLDLGRRVLVEERDAVPHQRAAVEGDEQRSLADRQRRVDADAVEAGVVADVVVVACPELLGGRPPLSGLGHVLALVLADRTALGRRLRRRVLRSRRSGRCMRSRFAMMSRHERRRPALRRLHRPPGGRQPRGRGARRGRDEPTTRCSRSRPRSATARPRS